MPQADTIFALATPPGTGGVAVVRVSGPHALAGLRSLTGRARFAPRHATLAALRLPVSRETLLDRALVLFFPAPHSYTGEDTAEYHLHGGCAVVAGVLDALAALPGHRPAEPGAFTRRAFANGKMDRTAAEGLADLIAAQTQAQAAQALAQMDGALARVYRGWTDRAARALALAEAALEFPDEDLPPGMPDAALAAAHKLYTDIEAHLADARGMTLRDGVRIVLTGAPNAGKSTLLNALARRDVAIVTDTPGTTRDVLEVPLDLGGVPVVLCDTAGLREAACAVEAEGVRRARAAAAAADIVLALVDGTAESVSRETPWTVYTKSDAPGFAAPPGALAISAKTGAGLDALLARLTDAAVDLTGGREAPALTRTRHRVALTEAAAHLARTQSATAPELAAEDLRLAVRALGRLTGAVDVEEVLDALFAEFCIGK
ncbi:MAG TPA: tRNA uridine-5-carboxymethylaminomethyl(34) synthesis GTPase MnmE [Rhodospirillaceae bacterium]|mgnify:CR=1 FL=1|nr:tRNA uridine-5-carboxymethylaminomethyl(34) synthesis GTPase MnmE [Rhodospirillaceae bacterium]